MGDCKGSSIAVAQYVNTQVRNRFKEPELQCRCSYQTTWCSGLICKGVLKAWKGICIPYAFDLGGVSAKMWCEIKSVLLPNRSYKLEVS